MHRERSGFTEEMQLAVAGERTGQQAHFSEYLEAVADAQHRAATRREGGHLTQQRRDMGNGATT